MTAEKQQDLAEAARAWVVRHASGEMTQSEQAAFRAWIAASQSHARAFAEEDVFWRRLGPLEETFERLEQAESAKPRRQFRLIRATVGAALALAACLLLLVAGPQLLLRLQADHINGEDAVLAVRLADGSQVTLDRNSAIRVDYNSSERRIELLRGEVFAEVVPDAGRPFRIEAAGGVSEALGTAYAVRLQDGGARVAVTEGLVRVQPAPGKAVAQQLTAGRSLRYDSEGQVSGPYDVDPGRVLAWRRDRLVLVDRPLDQALAELDRYVPGRILLIAGSRKTVPVSGVIDLNRPEAGLAALAATHGLTVHHLTPFLTVLR